MKRPPHILVFNPDQWRSDVLGHMGNPAAVTPNLDRFAREDGVSFRHAFCQNPVCTPSRCSFMTGWYPHVRGHRTMRHMLHPEWNEPNLLRILKEHGYYTYWGGKNDLVPGQNPQWDLYCDVYNIPDPERLQPNWHGEVLQKARGGPDSDNYFSFHVGKMEKLPGQEHYLDSDWAHVEAAIDFIHRAPDDRPVCLYLPLVYPHPPYAVEEPYYSAIDRGLLPPRAIEPDWQTKPSLLRGIRERQRLQGWTEERWTELRATYYGMCARVDHQFGLIVEALKERGLYDETAVFLFADHGDFTGDYGLVEKTQNTFEDCLTAVPFLVKPPRGIPVQPRVSEALVELTDFSETVYDFTGIEPGYTRFGRSLRAVLSGETDEHRDAVFCEGGRRKGEIPGMEYDPETVAEWNRADEKMPYWPRVALQSDDSRPYHSKAAMCRVKNFKYVRRLDESDELYDLKNDPRELRNAIDDPAYAQVLSQLKDRMLTWYMDTCDEVPHNRDNR